MRAPTRRICHWCRAQHAAAALGQHSVVCWIGNTPEQFGYDIHTNIIANNPTIKPELRHSVYSKYNISGTPTEFPYNNEGEIFNVEEIIEALRNDKQPQGETESPLIESEEKTTESKKKRKTSVLETE